MTTESAMNLVAMTLKSWHYQMAPKYSYDYFIQRCQALGSHKVVSVIFMLSLGLHEPSEKNSQRSGTMEIN